MGMLTMLHSTPSAPESDSKRSFFLLLLQPSVGKSLITYMEVLYVYLQQRLIIKLTFFRVWGIISLSLAFIWQLYTLWLLIQLHESVPGTRYSRYLRLSMAAFGKFPIRYTCREIIILNDYASSLQKITSNLSISCIDWGKLLMHFLNCFL